MKRWIVSLILVFTVLSLQAQEQTPQIHHELSVTLSPEEGAISVTDTITLPHEVEELDFLLHANLELSPLPEAFGVTTERLEGKELSLVGYSLRFNHPVKTLTLTYSGKIQHELGKLSQGYGDSRQSSRGMISPEGVFLGASSFWYPMIGNERFSFSLNVTLPEGWQSISQGEETAPNHWVDKTSQEEIYLIAGRFSRYRQPGPVATAEVYLRDEDPDLAARYLKATEEYLDLYNEMIGPYPFAKFALVENFWESGYGMPSFTLLGSRVIRLPFILSTSYPHEVVHNWFGNGVYVDYTSGNWSEGLTTYLADHLNSEKQGSSANYRRDTLKNYAAYVDTAKDFPLTEFRGNHGSISQAVGYGKTMMLAHMLRTRLGEQLFIKGLRTFYQDYKFKQASFSDLISAFERASGKSLENEFKQWVVRPGAPVLALGETQVEKQNNEFILTVTLKQQQPEEPFFLRVPLYIQVVGHDRAVKRDLVMSNRETTFRLTLKRRPVKLAVDPNFDIFRRLGSDEIPTSLAQMFGAKQLTIITPSDANRRMRKAYTTLAESWAARQKGIEIVEDLDIEKLPEDRLVWIFGSNNRFAPAVLDNLTQKKQVDDIVTLSGALTAPHPANPDLTIALLNIEESSATEGLARKLPHYGKYSYALFSGSEPQISSRGQWMTSSSTLARTLDAEYAAVELALFGHKSLIHVMKNPDQESTDDEGECE